uniref:FYVE, RhoGEF and PH domain containing 5a n=1 Tax=Hucho hucho TaxID=62062 RepID=A0A4W5NTW6_9TELE
MSKPCPSTRGPKPPTTAMPRPSSSETEAEEEQCPPHGLSNGDLTSSEGEPEDNQEGSEDPIPHSTDHNQEEAAPEEILNDNDITDYGEKENEQEEGDEVERESNASEMENTGSSDTHSAVEEQTFTATDDLNPPESDNDGTSVDPENHLECDNVFLCERGDVEGGGIKEQEEDNQKAFEEDIEELDCHIVPYHEDSDSDSEEHIYEEAGFDSEGENFMSLDRKNIVTRSRSYSGKVSGYVPETVPEETSEYQSTYDYCTVALDQNGEPLRRLEQPEVNRLIPSLKPRHFLLYPNSYSAEGRELSLGAHTEADQSLKDDGRMKRTDDTLSLPCVSTSSGSFSQRSHQSSSDVSMPTSLVDIPPPFELAYITKRPVTKSSPSLLISVSPESTDNKSKKKKSSFKRFMALKFKRKTDTKGFGDGSIRSSRSSSESSHHGPTRILELERRSTGSPQPQSQSRMVKLQQRPPDLPSTFLLYKDLRKEDPKAYGSRVVSRVESFEERSRRPLMPLPLTKPRSISFPSADTSEYENIPAMSSDYENIQIRPGGRPTRSMKVTDFFEDPKRIVAPSNDNDGYVDMNSFPGIDSKPQSPEQEPERYSNLLYLSEAVGEDGEPVVEEQRLGEILGTLPEVYILHSNILTELDSRIRQWEESQRVVDVILSRREEFAGFATYISEYDRSMSLLAESCKLNPAFHDIVKQFEVRATHPFPPPSLSFTRTVSLFTHLSLSSLVPLSLCLSDTQENLLRLVHIEYSVRGKRDLLKPGRVRPMNDVMLYTYPQQDGKYRLKNTLYLSGMKHVYVHMYMYNYVYSLNCFCVPSSCGEREDWFHTLSRAIADHAAREKLWMALGEAAPVLVPATHVMMCMNCTSDFSLTLRRHHCNACGKVVCRACSRNRYPLKYLKDRMAKVCDHCYAELRKRGVSISGCHNLNSFLFSKFSKNVIGIYSLVCDLSLINVPTSLSLSTQDKMASESLPLQSFTVKLTERPEGEESSNVFQLYHKKTLYYTFRADDQYTARRWVNAMEEATVL